MGCLFCGLAGMWLAPRGLELNKGVLLALDLGLKVGRGQLQGGGNGEQGDERGEDGLHRGGCVGAVVDLRREHTEPRDFVSGGCGLCGAGRVTGRQGRGPKIQGMGKRVGGRAGRADAGG